MKLNGKMWQDYEVKMGLCNQSHPQKIQQLLQQDFIWKLMDTVVNIPSNHCIHSNTFN